jgi:two-component system, OmpR family, alkaline phosphatase synthesis response regulator PhoP
MSPDMKKRVLIIDDNEQDRKAMTLALAREGYMEVASAADESEGLALAKTFLPEVVVIDCVLTQLDGFDVCRQIRDIDGIEPKIIVITGQLEAVHAPKARVSGADELLEKTVGFHNIHSTIERLFAEN